MNQEELEQSISGNLAAVHSRIVSACEKSRRAPEEIALVAISKTAAAEQIAAAVKAGQTVFGENYVQEAQAKAEELRRILPANAEVSLHLTGALQRNKVKRALEIFDLIQTVDRVELAREISKQAEQRGKLQRLLIEVNAAQEESKAGVVPDELPALIEAALKLPALSIEGLMTIGRCVPDTASRDERAQDFAKLNELYLNLRRSGINLTQLSMGMSHDFELAIEYGATIIRVGTAIFGERR